MNTKCSNCKCYMLIPEINPRSNLYFKTCLKCRNRTKHTIKTDTKDITNTDGTDTKDITNTDGTDTKVETIRRKK